MTPPSRSAPLATLLQRVREQYRDTPGLTLTKPQATRLFGVAPSVCAANAQRARAGELSVAQRRGSVRARDHILTNEPTATACKWFSTGLESSGEQSSTPHGAKGQSVPFIRDISSRGVALIASRRWYESKGPRRILWPRRRVGRGRIGAGAVLEQPRRTRRRYRACGSRSSAAFEVTLKPVATSSRAPFSVAMTRRQPSGRRGVFVWDGTSHSRIAVGTTSSAAVSRHTTAMRSRCCRHHQRREIEQQRGTPLGSRFVGASESHVNGGVGEDARGAVPLAGRRR